MRSFLDRADLPFWSCSEEEDHSMLPCNLKTGTRRIEAERGFFEESGQPCPAGVAGAWPDVFPNFSNFFHRQLSQCPFHKTVRWWMISYSRTCSKFSAQTNEPCIHPVSSKSRQVEVARRAKSLQAQWFAPKMYQPRSLWTKTLLRFPSGPLLSVPLEDCWRQSTRSMLILSVDFLRLWAEASLSTATFTAIFLVVDSTLRIEGHSQKSLLWVAASPPHMSVSPSSQKEMSLGGF